MVRGEVDAASVPRCEHQLVQSTPRGGCVTQREYSEMGMDKPADQPPTAQIPRQAVRLLWHCGYWDGPLSGVCLYQGERCWFEAIDPFDEELDDYVYPRRAGLYRLSPDELQVQEELHRQFQRDIGMHTDYDEHEQRPFEGAVRPRDEWKGFEVWLQHQPKRTFDFRQNVMLGWFDLGSFHDMQRLIQRHPRTKNRSSSALGGA